jgi:hypothetical protein
MFQQHQQNTIAAIRNIMNNDGGSNGSSNNNNTYNFNATPPARTNSSMGQDAFMQQQYDSLNNDMDSNYLNGLNITRAISAPPQLELSTNTLFASHSGYGHLFGDIRCEQSYESFYRSHQDPSQLPPPLENDSLFFSFNKFNHFAAASNNNENSAFFSSGATMFNDIRNHQQTDSQWSAFSGAVQSGNGHLYGQAQSQQHFDGQHGMSYIASPVHPLKQPSHLHYSSQMDEQSFFSGLYPQPTLQQPQQQPHQQSIVSPRLYQPQAQRFSANAALSSQNDAAEVEQDHISSSDEEESSYSHVAAKVRSKTSQTKVHKRQGSEQTSDQTSASTASQASSKGEKGSEKASRMNLSKVTNMKDAQGKIVKLAKDQHGCRFLQKKLEEKNEEDLKLIFNEVYDHIAQLMVDPFGNYLCQKLVEHCNDTQKSSIIKAVSGDLVKISMNMHGTRAVQKLIECLSTPQQIKAITVALRSHVVPLIKDLNGNHVIQRCLQKLSYQDKHFIYDAVVGRCVEVATHKHGCCVLQRCIDSASPDQRMMLVREIATNALVLVQNPFGNYVVQYVLNLGDDNINDMVIAKFLGNVGALSTNKFSSNVIEKCLSIGSSQLKSALIGELLDCNMLPNILQDSYGNYVVQTALSVADNRQFLEFAEVLKPLLHLIKNTPYGKKIESRLNKRLAMNATSTGEDVTSPSLKKGKKF